MEKPDLQLKDLNQFTGTDHYYRYMGLLITDGIAYIMKNGYGWFVSDAVAVIIAHKKIREYLRENTFLTIKLKINKDKDGNKTADMIITDGNETTLYTQHYDLTDAERELTLFYDNGVLMLSNEY